MAAYLQTLTIQTALTGNTVKIRICNNGKGMTEEVKACIFDHWFTTKGVGKGTELESAIVRQIVEEKQGKMIMVNSEMSQGTEFLFPLPLR